MCSLFLMNLRTGKLETLSKAWHPEALPAAGREVRELEQQNKNPFGLLPGPFLCMIVVGILPHS